MKEISGLFQHIQLKKYKNEFSDYKEKILINVKETINKYDNNYVIKYDGLAGGKGVKVSGDHIKNEDEAIEFINSFIINFH